MYKPPSTPLVILTVVRMPLKEKIKSIVMICNTFLQTLYDYVTNVLLNVHYLNSKEILS